MFVTHFDIGFIEVQGAVYFSASLRASTLHLCEDPGQHGLRVVGRQSHSAQIGQIVRTVFIHHGPQWNGWELNYG